MIWLIPMFIGLCVVSHLWDRRQQRKYGNDRKPPRPRKAHYDCGYTSPITNPTYYEERAEWESWHRRHGKVPF